MPSSTKYEREFAAFLAPEAPQAAPQAHAFAFWKGRVALYAILKALQIGPGDEVILPGFTCVVVPNAIRLTGATPVYVDIPPDGYNVRVQEIQPAITARTRAIIVQHTFGIPVDLEPVLALAAEHGLPVLEDCAHALGTHIQGRHVGLWGQAAFFSSQWSKPYTTGLGGVAVTTQAEFAERLGQVQASFHPAPAAARARLWLQYQLYRYFFSPRLYWQAQSAFRLLGRLGLFVGSSSTAELAGEKPTDHEWRMGGFQEKVGQRHVQHVQPLSEQRRQLSTFYTQTLAQAGWPVVQHLEETTLLRYPVRVSNKVVILAQASQFKLELGSWFETPLHPIALDQHSQFGYRLGQCPHAEQAAAEVVNLPLHHRITLPEAQRVMAFFLAHAQK